MLQIPTLGDSDERDRLVEDVQKKLRRPLDAARFADARQDLSSLARACRDRSGGLRAFADLVHRREASEKSERLVALVDGLLQAEVLSPPDRDTLRAYLADVAVGHIATAVGDLVEADQLRSLESWVDVPTAIRMLESLPEPDDGVPQLLVFTDRLANIVAGWTANNLRRWTDRVAGGLGVDEASLANLRAVSARAVAGGRLASGQAGQQGPSTGEQPPRPRRSDESGLVWGGVPLRNRHFSGRDALLDRLGEALRMSAKASVLPQTLHGMGGVGKTQLVLEYVYRHVDEYDIVWWIPSEQISSVLSSLSQLAARLGLIASTEDRQQTARSVLDALAGAQLSWLLVYDNADDPAALEPFIPSTGGHVVVTTRNREWATVGHAVEVDVFERHESIELLRRRTGDEHNAPMINDADAEALAEKLGDLPLALEQAVAWYLATAMPVREYIGLLDSRIKDILSEGKPTGYPLTVAAFVTFAVEQLREKAPAAAQLFELFAFLGGEPVSVSLLRRGGDADLSEPLRGTLGSPIPTNRTVRDLNRYGLAKVDALQRVQVHRLVQRVLRDSLPEDLADQSLRNAQRLLTKADPGDPDENPDVSREDMGPHIEPARLIHAPDLRARQVVLHYSRYLYVTGDYENSLRLAERAGAAWAADPSHAGFGPDGELTLMARSQAANARRALGDSAEAAVIARDTYDRLTRNPALGPRHEWTLITGNQVGHDLRIKGAYLEALEFDLRSVALHAEIFEHDSSYTLRAKRNLGVDYRMVGQFAKAYIVDEEIASRWRDVRANDPRALEAYMNLARTCYGLGAYRLGLETLERWQQPLREALGAEHSQVLLAGRTQAILLRKLGRLDAALDVIRDHEQRTTRRFAGHHEFAVAATVSHANLLRELGRLDDAAKAIEDALARYREHFGDHHPLTLVTQVNEAILRRARGESAQARALDEFCFTSLAEVLAPDHPYTICAGVGLATDLARAGEHEAALDLSTRMLELSQATTGGGHEARNGAQHPYLLMRKINLSHDLRAVGQDQDADAHFAAALAGLKESLGNDHPEVRMIERGERTEGDIEAPPT